MRYKLLGKSGLRVSEICLGTMSFGTDWGFGADEATSHDILSAYADAGGNFLDTADKYHNGETEEYIGISDTPAWVMSLGWASPMISWPVIMSRTC